MTPSPSMSKISNAGPASRIAVKSPDQLKSINGRRERHVYL